MQKVIIKDNGSPEQSVALTAAIRDLHRLCPGQFRVGVVSSHPDIWHGNPYLADLRADDPEVCWIELQEEKGSDSPIVPRHRILKAFDLLNDALGLRLVPTSPQGDLHLLPEEKPAANVDSPGLPCWLLHWEGIGRSSTTDWNPSYLREVVESLKGRVRILLYPGAGVIPPELPGEVVQPDGHRDLIRLVHRADGIICPPSLVMHLAAAVELKPGQSVRSCVVVAGGSRHVPELAYPQHQFLHTVGALACCGTQACGKSFRKSPGHPEGTDPDWCDRLTLAGETSQCMDLIKPKDVLRAVERHLGTTITAAAPIEVNPPATRAILIESSESREQMAGILTALAECVGIQRFEVIPSDRRIEAALGNFRHHPWRKGSQPARIERQPGPGWDHAFDRSGFVVHMPPGAVPARDCLKFLLHCDKVYGQDPEIGHVSAWNDAWQGPDAYYELGRRPSSARGITGWWHHRQPTIKDEAVDASTGIGVEVFPLLSRCRMIGALEVEPPWAGQAFLPPGPYFDPLLRQVTAVMVTGLDSRRYPLARQAIRCFQAQTYPLKDLLIINHGDEDLAPPFADDRIRELRVVKHPDETIGDLRNIGLREAKGDLILNWDDDDWYAPERMEVQAQAQRGKAVVVLGNQLRYNMLSGSAYCESAAHGISGTLLHPREIPFRYKSLVRGSDSEFFGRFRRQVVLDNSPLLYLRFYHGMNLWDARHIMQHLAGPERRGQLQITETQRRFLERVLQNYPPAEVIG